MMHAALVNGVKVVKVHLLCPGVDSPKQLENWLLFGARTP